MQFSAVLIGNESLLVQCAQTLLARGNTIAAMVTQNAQVSDWAVGEGLRVERQASAVTDLTFDWLLSIANLSIIPDDVLSRPTQGAINFHDGPLPRHAGLNAPLWALLEGETQHGIAWHMIEGGVDEGDILVSRAFDITAGDTALTLNAKAYTAAIDSFPALLDQLESRVLQRRPQDLSKRSYHRRDARPTGQGLLDFSRSAAELERLVRALDHGAYWNPLATPKIWVKDRFFAVGTVRIAETQAAPGVVLDVAADHLTVACEQQALVLSGLRDLTGRPVLATGVIEPGVLLQTPDLAALDRTVSEISPHEAFWRTRLREANPVRLMRFSAGATDLRARPLALSPAEVPQVVAALACQLGSDTATIAYADSKLARHAGTGLVSPWVPLTVAAENKRLAGEALEMARKEAQMRCGFFSDLQLRDAALSDLRQPDFGLSDDAAIPGCAVTIVSGANPTLYYDAGRIDEEVAERLAQRLEVLATVDSTTAISDLPTMGTEERDAVLNRWNATAVDHDRTLTMHRAFEAQVDRTPDGTALIFETETITYADLDARSNRAAHLLQKMGVRPGQVVGLCCRRSIDLMVGALAILKAGGAYLPMDPSYPADRLKHFVKDSGATVIVTQADVEPTLPPHEARLLVLDAEPRLDEMSVDRLPDTSAPEDLAYLIYTSGSTGKPKGVMVEHRNVLNFFTGMDSVIPQGGTWLAVTSLSFDISVLELFWTTARGFAVVLTGDADRSLISKGPMPRGAAGMEFSIYYWGNDDGVGRDKYRLLLEGAKFADENGFVAVWTPERHFHAFGGPYPNPSVTGAAVAGVTKTIGVRGGSVVAPLHHPARIAEEWAVIDNLTNGRAGMAIASGWQPDDFVLRPENTPPDNKAAMMRDLETVRKLWRGEAVAFPRKDGSMHEVVTQPRPVSQELPVWVTTAGNPQTWRDAGLAGCNVLTHLLGQSVSEVGDKIELYHAALREAGHDPADFTVTLMLHTFLSDSRDHAREIARGPMKDYLSSAAGLIKQYAWAFPAFKRPAGVKNAFDLQLDGLEPEELDAILDFAFERYFNDSGLFGTVEDALKRTKELKAIGVTEIACLIDYGIDRETVLDGLKPLAQVVQAAAAEPELAADDFSIAAQIVRHGVTHLQCTPSMARMIAMNDEARFALSRVQHVYLGGEPLPGTLVDEFAQITQATITNMYGPTETTIWSSSTLAEPGDGIVNVGLPLANQQFYVLDARLQPVPLGAEGELWIGGEGVTRGYWNRPDMTAERFAENPFHPGRMYRTGDLVRRRADGRIDFVGRVDHQVKIRGHRIELGEIEAALEAQRGIVQAVVNAREDVPGDVRLVGYVTGVSPAESVLKSALSAVLPAIMVPQYIVHLDEFPLTPNKKVDRNALPPPTVQKLAPGKPALPVTQSQQQRDAAAVEKAIAEIWSRTLGVQDINSRDSFFDLGGHSLLAVQAHRKIRDELGAQALSITDIFRFPVLADLAIKVSTMVESVPQASTAPARSTAGNRAQSRTDAMARRREMRARRRA